MKRRIFYLFLIIPLALLMSACASTADLGHRHNRKIKINEPRTKKIEIPFRLINNLVVIPVQINDSEVLHFVLDTGVSRIIITDLSTAGEVTLNYTQEVLVRGIGSDEPIEALYSENNRLFMDGVSGDSLVVIAIPDGIVNLSKVMGSEINGLIGYDIFSNFIVETNYEERKLFLHDPDLYAKRYRKKKKHRYWKNLELKIENRKPYVLVPVTQSDGTELDISLLLDSGASHAVTLYPTTDDRIYIPDKKVYSYLGTGLSGDIYGYIGRAVNIELGTYNLKNPIVYYPDAEGIQHAVSEYYKNGSIGAEVLKRFKVFVNYEDSTMLLRRNGKFRNKFYYNMAGVEITTPYPDLPIFEITWVRENSPAELAGVRVGDVIESLNNETVYTLTLSKIYDIFLNDEGKKINLVLKRNENEVVEASFRLVDELK